MSSGCAHKILERFTTTVLRSFNLFTTQNWTSEWMIRLENPDDQTEPSQVLRVFYRTLFWHLGQMGSQIMEQRNCNSEYPPWLCSIKNEAEAYRTTRQYNYLKAAMHCFLAHGRCRKLVLDWLWKNQKTVFRLLLVTSNKKATSVLQHLFNKILQYDCIFIYFHLFLVNTSFIWPWTNLVLCIESIKNLRRSVR